MSSSLPPNSRVAPEESLHDIHKAAAQPRADLLEELLDSLRLTDPGSLEEIVNLKTSESHRSGGYTPLHYACQYGNPRAVRLLLDAGANPNARKNNGATPLLCVLNGAGYCEDLKEEMDDYRECASLLLEHPRFDLVENDRDGDARCSPAWVCCGQRYTSPDVLLPFLLHLLLRGFDPDGCIWGYSALHMALRMGHLKCAMLALVRSGADIEKLAPKNVGPPDVERVNQSDKWSALEACYAMYGKDEARSLEEAAAASTAVAGAKKRRNILRESSGNTEGVKKMAKKAMGAGTDLIKASRWKEAAGAYMEVAEYISQDADSLDDQERFLVLGNLSACMLQLRRGDEACQFSRQLVELFPDQPGALVSLGTAMLNPCRGEPSQDELEELKELSRRTEQLVKDAAARSPGNFDYVEPFSQLTLQVLLDRAHAMQDQVSYWSEKDSQNPAVKAALIAMDEYNNGDYVKAAIAIDKALLPELNHPKPYSTQAMKGSIYTEWAREILENNISLRGSRFVPSESSSGEEPLPWTCGKEKIEIALEAFKSAFASGQLKSSQATVSGWNAGLSYISLGHFNKGRKLCNKYYRERLYNMLPDKGATSRDYTDEFGAIGHEKLLVHLEMALKLNSMLVVFEATDESEAELAEDEKTALYDLFEEALELHPLEASAMQRLGSHLEGTQAGDLWGRAVHMVEEGQHMLEEFRVEAAKVAVQSVLEAKHRIRNSSSRVVGVLLKEALFWDPNVTIPKELDSAHRRAAEPIRCGNCNAAKPRKNCPCGEAHYCCRECQVEDWKHHKKTCKHRKSEKAKKKGSGK